jgi:hypothetical protein
MDAPVYSVIAHPSCVDASNSCLSVLEIFMCELKLLIIELLLLRFSVFISRLLRPLQLHEYTVSNYSKLRAETRLLFVFILRIVQFSSMSCMTTYNT